MKHIAIPSLSLIRKDYPYTTPGLGDRIHTILFAFNYATKNNTNVKLHLTQGQCSDERKKSWDEIISLLPQKNVEIQRHDILDITTSAWVKLLADKGLSNVQTCHYGDHRFRFEDKSSIDISPYLDHPCLKPITDIDLPDKFVTMQFDSGGIPSMQKTNDRRKISYQKIKEIKQRLVDKGYDIIVIGGEAEDERFRRLKYCGAALSKAKYHIGADSGFMHLAWMYKKPEDIYIYTNGNKSHHVMRAERKGSKVIKV